MGKGNGKGGCDGRGSEPRKIIVDIDNTLWPFAPVLYEYLKKISPSIPPIDRWGEWEFWGKDIDRKTFYRVLKEIHMKQEEFEPFKDARQFLLALKERGLFIIIASHREEESYEPTLRWLRKYDLPSDEVYVMNDKSVLFDGAFGVVDDSPSTLEKGRMAGILCTGLVFPWNRGLGYPLFESLPEVLAYIDENLR